ncbi:MAG: hypothetical protein GF331_08185, partial [Chitinivibrionales bacterium]|nr:hypothetical protein [Chitinivibrionales bacterium]
MYGTKQYEGRLWHFINTVHRLRYEDPHDLRVSYIYDQQAPIPYERALHAEYKPIKKGETWGAIWG